MNSEPKTEVRTCRECGCTDDDCRQCIEKTGRPCYWVEPDLCSACDPNDSSKKFPDGMGDDLIGRDPYFSGFEHPH